MRKTKARAVLRMDTSLGQRIRNIRGKEAQDAFAVKIGITRGSLSAYERDKTPPPADILQTICTKYQISADWLLFGDRLDNSNNFEQKYINEQKTSVDHQRKLHRIDEIKDVDRTDGQTCDVDLVMIPMVEARLSAGTGSLETSCEIEKTYAFRADFLRRKGRPDKMVLMRVDGDSMQPEIMNKDVVLIDQSKTNIRAGQIFAVGFEDAIYLKRIDTLPGKIILKSTNPAYPPVEIQVGEQDGNAFRIIGQVIWCGREY